MSRPVGREENEQAGHGRPRESFATKLDRLFRMMHPRDRGPYTLEEVVEIMRQRGIATISINYLAALRKGTRDNPTKQQLEGLADVFGVPVGYFFDEDDELVEEIADW